MLTNLRIKKCRQNSGLEEYLTCLYNPSEVITRWSALLGRNIHLSLPASIAHPRDCCERGFRGCWQEKKKKAGQGRGRIQKRKRDQRKALQRTLSHLRSFSLFVTPISQRIEPFSWTMFSLVQARVIPDLCTTYTAIYSPYLIHP